VKIKEAKNTKHETFLAYLEFPCTIAAIFLLDIFKKLSSELFIAVNEVNSKHKEISRNLVKFHGKIYISKEVQVPLK